MITAKDPAKGGPVVSAPKKMSRKAKAVIYYGLLSFLAAVFLLSAGYVGKYVFNSIKNRSEYDKLQEQMGQHWATRPSLPPSTQPVTPGVTDPVPTDPPAPTAPPEPTEPHILPEYQEIYQQNSDTVGWIYIPGTKVNYPVMQTPDRPDFYLKHRFDKAWSDWGCIYVRETCDVFAPSDNLVLYGHHMKDGSMFAGLDPYKKQAFWQDNQYFYLDNLYQRHTYQVFAAFKTSANADEGYPYHLFNDAANQEEFDSFVSTVKSLSYYDTGITPQYGDKLITLSTCEYTLANGRFVVVAVRID